MAQLTIILGNKAYSSWSLRGWLMLERCGVSFGETVVPLYRPESRTRLLEHSPAGLVPVLKDGPVTVWDTLAIAEYLHERFPGAGLWPEDPAARARARSLCAEMHAGFGTLRDRLPMNLRRDAPEIPEARAPEGRLAAEIDRIVAIWRACLATVADGYLFGDFCAADAFFAPVAVRFATYGVPITGAAAGYRDRLLAWQALRDWTEAARAEPWTIESYE